MAHLYKQSFKNKNETCELFVTRNQLPDMCLSYNKGVFVQLHVPKSSHRVHPSLSFLKGNIICSCKKYVKGNCWAVNSTQSQACENGKHSKGKENKESNRMSSPHHAHIYTVVPFPGSFTFKHLSTVKREAKGQIRKTNTDT